MDKVIVKDMFVNIKQHYSQNCYKNTLIYFEKEWLKNPYKRHLWNYKSLFQDIAISDTNKIQKIIHFTNNVSESIHSRLNQNVGSGKVSIQNFERALQLAFIGYSIFRVIIYDSYYKNYRFLYDNFF